MLSPSYRSYCGTSPMIAEAFPTGSLAAPSPGPGFGPNYSPTFHRSGVPHGQHRVGRMDGPGGTFDLTRPPTPRGRFDPGEVARYTRSGYIPQDPLPPTPTPVPASDLAGNHLHSMRQAWRGTGLGEANRLGPTASRSALGKNAQVRAALRRRMGLPPESGAGVMMSPLSRGHSMPSLVSAVRGRSGSALEVPKKRDASATPPGEVGKLMSSGAEPRKLSAAAAASSTISVNLT